AACLSAVDWAQVDDATAGGASHVRHDETRETRGREEQNIEGLAPDVVFIAGGREVNAVDEDIDEAEALGGGTHEALGIGGDCEVAGEGLGFGAVRIDFFRSLAQGLLAASAEGVGPVRR